ARGRAGDAARPWDDLTALAGACQVLCVTKQPSSRMPSTRVRRWKVRLEAEFGHRDVTGEVTRLVEEAGVQQGIAVVSLTGSTGAVTTIEYEAGALSDLRRALDALAPAGEDYAHNARWGDGNGFSHVRSALLKP